MQLSLFPSKKSAPAREPSPQEKQLRAMLDTRIPEAAMDQVARLVFERPVSLLVTPHRTSRLGVYRPAQRHLPARISVNGSLNPYAFLITLVHEVAHHHVQTDYIEKLNRFSLKKRKKPLPHGDEWKEKFRHLMQPFLSEEIFPRDLLTVVQDYMKNPAASSSSDRDLGKALRQFDPPDTTILLETLPSEALFLLNGRRLFKKKEKVRTRYRCICLQTNRVYLVNATAPVVEISPE